MSARSASRDSTEPVDRPRRKRAKTAPNSVENPTLSTTSADALAGSIEKPATTKALNTNELLQLILSKIPQENRLDLPRVSHAWNNAIDFQAKPIDVSCWLEQLEESWVHGNIAKIPHYSADIDFEINPALADQSKPYKGRMGVLPHNFEPFDPPPTVSLDDNGLDFTVNFDIMSDSEVAKLKAREHEFLTKPPITRLLAQSFLSRTNAYATLSITGGIRIGDLLQTWLKMKASWAISMERYESPGNSRALFVSCRHKDADDGPYEQYLGIRRQKG